MLLAGPVQPAVANRPPPPRPGLSWAEADVLAQALEEVEAAFKAGKPVTKLSLVVTEAQLNSYLNLTLGPNMPPGVSDVAVQLADNGLVVRAKVDLDRVPLKRPTGGAWSLYSLLSGVVPGVRHPGPVPPAVRDEEGPVRARASGGGFLGPAASAPRGMIGGQPWTFTRRSST